MRMPTTPDTMSSTVLAVLLQLSLASSSSSSSNNNDSIFDPQPQQYIVGGTPASHKRYPYLVSLGTDRTATDHSCAATLVAPDVLLSAAHCQGSFRFATLGMSDRSNAHQEEKSGQRITIRTDKTVVHPAYRWTAANPDIDFDFMLVKLTSPVDTDQFPPVQLNRNPRVPRRDAEPLTIVGWGATDVYGQRLSPTLQQATVGYVSPATCDQSDGYIQGAYYSYRGFLTSSMMCAWSGSADACLGDSGGPLVASVGGEDEAAAGNGDVQVGIVSFGVGCNSPDFPGLYSRISDQIGWIDEVVCELSDDPPPEFECVRPEEETDSPTRRPTTARPTVRPTLRPSAAPVGAGKQQSVLEFLLGTDPEEDSGVEDESSDAAGSMPMASPTVFEEPVTEPTDPPFAADLVWFDEEDAVDKSTANGVESQMQGNSESNDGLVLIIAASVGGVAFVALLAVMALLISKRRKENNAHDNEKERPASFCVRVLQQQDAECQTMDHRGRQRASLGTATAEEEPSVEIVADAYR